MKTKHILVSLVLFLIIALNLSAQDTSIYHKKYLHENDSLVVFVPNTHGSCEYSADMIITIQGKFSNYHLVIFNRWGDVIFESKDVENRWDFTYKGERLGSAVFVYRLRLNDGGGKEHEYTGNFTLIR